MKKDILSEREYIELLETLLGVLNKTNLNDVQKTDILAIMLIGHLSIISTEYGLKVAEMLSAVPGLLVSREDTVKKNPEKENKETSKLNFRSLGQLGIVKDHWGLDPALLTNNH